MSEPVIRYAFIAGELSPNLFGRGDIEKYDLGLALCRNFFVDYRGGITTRGGMQFVGEAEGANLKIIPFTFANNIENTYLMVFGDQYVRFIQDGGYVTETTKNIGAATTSNPIILTVTAHGYSNGDWIFVSGVVGMTELNGRIFEVGSATTNTFVLIDVVTGLGVDSSLYATYTSGGTTARIYTVTTPYLEADVSDLRATQDKDTVFLTHPNYEPRKLVRSAATSWALSPVAVNATGTAPSPPTLTPSSAGSAGVAFAVSAYYAETGESRISRPTVTETSVNYAATAGSMLVEWTALSGVQYYNIYRSIIHPTGTEITFGAELGFVGRAYAPQFTDNNIIPDFTKAPPIGSNPFAQSTILSIDVTAGGSGYAKNSAVTVTDATGSGFVGYPIVSGGAVIGIRVVDGGKDYSAPSVSVSGGTGATFTVNLGEATGTYPRVSAKFQQRLVFGGAVNSPLTVVGSRIGNYENFDVTIPPSADDSISYTMDSQRNDPILHLVSLQGGMLVMTASGVWQLKGAQGKAVTALEAVADPQVFNGCSDVEPILIDTDLFYTQAKGAVVRRLSYNIYSTAYTSEDMSTLSNHLFGNNKEVVRFAYAENPYQIVWGARSDGTMLSMTYVKDQNVNGWAAHTTKGLAKDCVLVEENNEDIIYWVVERFIKGVWTRYIERMPANQFNHVEEAWTLDSALRSPLTYPAADLTISATTGTVTLTASAGVFGTSDVGKIVRAGGGKMKITARSSSTSVTATVQRSVTAVLSESSTPLPVGAGDWSIASEITSVSGLWHLEGESVQALADGNVVRDLTVVNGSVTLPRAYSHVTVGLFYKCRGKTLPLTFPGEVIEGRRSRIIGTAVRMQDARGLAFGEDGGRIYEIAERTTEPWGEPTNLISGVRYRTVEQKWVEGGALYWEQNYPLPASIIGLVLDIDVGDDKD